MKRLSILTASIALSACAGDKGPAPALKPPASVEYQLPVTSAKVVVDLVLQSCESNQPIATAKSVITPVANPNYAPEQRFRLYGANLSSFSKNRQLGVELYPHGAIKSINGGVADRSGAIITNVLKIGAGLIGFGAAPPEPTPLPGTCNSDTLNALAQVETLQRQIAALRTTLASAPPAAVEQTRLAIDALAAEVARLRTGPLSLSLEREIVFRKPFPAGTAGVPAEAMKAMEGGMISWTAAELSKWLVLPTGHSDTATQFGLAYCIRPATQHYAAGAVSCSSSLGDAFQKREKAAAPGGSYIEKPTCHDAVPTRSCMRTLVFREPVPSVLVLVSATDAIKGKAQEGSE